MLVVTVLALTRAASAEKTSRFAEMQRLSSEQANGFDAQVKENQGVGRSLATLAEGLDGKADARRDQRDRQALPGPQPADRRHLRRLRARTPSTAPDAAHKGEPGSDDKGRYGPYWNTLTGKVALDPLVDQDISDYWNQPKKTLADSVIEPYLYEGVLMTSYTSPVERDGKFVGIGGVDVSLTKINSDVAKLRMLDSGYGLLVSNGGIFVAAPDKNLIGKKTLKATWRRPRRTRRSRGRPRTSPPAARARPRPPIPSPARTSCSRGRRSRPASGASSPPSRSPR